jgi:hypothetical protein
MKRFFFWLVVMSITSIINVMHAQVVPADSNFYRVVKTNQQEYIGKIVNDDGREILLETISLGKLYITKSDIQSITRIETGKDMIDQEFRGKGVFSTRYQFSTNAFPIEKNENYAMINLYGPEVHFSVSKNFSVGVLATWIASPIVLALKYTIPTKNEKLNFGFGTLLGSVGYLNNSKGFGGLHWGMVTYGDRKNNVTLSLGYSYLNTQESKISGVNTPGTYPVSYYNVNTGVGYVSSPYEAVESVVPLIKGPTIGLAGIRSIGKKASFVFDMMFNYSQRITPTQSIEYINFDPITNIPASAIVGPVGSDSNVSTFINFMIMPGMRFQKNENKAFQVSLAGIIGSETKSYKKEHSFPFPMCTWFYKF